MTFIFITIGVFFILFEGVVICRNCYNNSTIWDWVRESLIALALASAIAGCFALDAKINEDTWNGGVCDCGGEYELVSVTKSKLGNETFYYACEDCKDMIETSAQMK